MNKRNNEIFGSKKYFNIMENGYKYDKRIFWGFMGLILTLLFFVMISEGFDFSYRFYFECKAITCKNPYYDTYLSNSITGQKWECLQDWCKKEFLNTGVYGKLPNPIVSYFSWFVWGGFLLTLILNHLIHNRGATPQIKINLPDKWIKRLKEVIENDNNN